MKRPCYKHFWGAEDTEKCPDCGFTVRTHKHNFILIKQKSLPLLTYHNFYKCECGEEYDDYEVMDLKIHPRFFRTDYGNTQSTTTE